MTHAFEFHFLPRIIPKYLGDLRPLVAYIVLQRLLRKRSILSLMIDIEIFR